MNFFLLVVFITIPVYSLDLWNKPAPLVVPDATIPLLLNQIVLELQNLQQQLRTERFAIINIDTVNEQTLHTLTNALKNHYRILTINRFSGNLALSTKGFTLDSTSFWYSLQNPSTLVWGLVGSLAVYIVYTKRKSFLTLLSYGKKIFTRTSGTSTPKTVG